MPADRHTPKRSRNIANPKQRRRRTIFRIAAPAAILTLIVGILSGWFSLVWRTNASSSGRIFGFAITQGYFAIASGEAPPGVSVPSGFKLEQFPVQWSLLPMAARTPASTQVGLPIWIPFLAFTIAAIVTRPRNFPASSCQNCGYNLIGTNTSTCPECGQTNNHITNNINPQETQNTSCESSTSQQD